MYDDLQIIPALRKYAAEKGEAGNVPVVLTTCFPEEQVCTHYAVRGSVSRRVSSCVRVSNSHTVVSTMISALGEWQGLFARPT